MKKKYKYWDVYDEMPKGWKVDKFCGSPLYKAVFITNGVPPIHGCKRALLMLKIESAPNFETSIEEKKEILTNNNIEIVSISKKTELPIFHTKKINDLARLKFMEKMLKEIIFDMKVCELEGWNKMEYINILKNIINKFGIH
jgi:hypothetical protein